MKRFLLYIQYILLIVLTSISNSVHAQLATEIPASYNVSTSGAFQYSIPLRLPPGIKDIVPNLAINYNSQTSNGTLGIGWSLSGLSAITRDVPDLYHDNTIQPIGFGSSDVLLLDGQRLISLSGTKYQTEVKNFADINFNSTGNYFTVEYPNGLTYEYGNTISSKMLAQGRTDVMLWAVNKVIDKYGNYITFEYINNQANGDYRISKITYGTNDKNSNSIPVYVNFVYATRPDANTAWIGGSKVTSNVLLSSIVVNFSTGAEANRYTFTYNTTNLALLTKIEEKRNGTDLLPPININWGTSSPSISNVSTTLGITSSNTVGIAMGDYNGDGKVDYIEKDNTQSHLYFGDGAGNFSQVSGANVPIITRGYNSTKHRHSFNSKVFSKKNIYHGGTQFDYDGDGMDDVIVVDMYNKGLYFDVINLTYFVVTTPYYEIWLYRANGSSTVFDPRVKLYSKSSIGANNLNDNFNSLTHIQAGDFDGDGKAELFIAHPYNFNNINSVADYEFIIVGDEYNNGHQIYHFSPGHIDGTLVYDYNGDGRDEFAVTHQFGPPNGDRSLLYGLDVYYDATTHKPILNQTSTHWPINHFCTGQVPYTFAKNWSGDFNGDGLDDMLVWNTTSQVWSLFYSNGTYDAYTNSNSVFTSDWDPAWPLPSLSTGGPSTANHSLHVADFNGDGLADILQILNGGTRTSPNVTYDIYYSKGLLNFSHETGTFPGMPGYEDNFIADFNRDGQLDIISNQGGTVGPQLISFYKNNNSLKVTSIEHAGKNLQVGYEYLTKDVDYQPTTAPSSAYSAKTFPIKVVKSLSDNVELNNQYKYTGLLVHKFGLGIRGFQTFNVTNAYGQKTYNVLNNINEHPYITQSTIFDPLGSSPFGIKTTFAHIDISGGASGRSRIIIDYPQQVIDYTKAQETITTLDLGLTTPGSVFYEYGSINSKSIQSKDLSGTNNTLNVTSYSYGSSWSANKGKPESVSVYNDLDPANNNSITRNTSYSYNTAGDVSTIITDPGANQVQTTYTYDVNGNVTDEDVSPAGMTPFTRAKYGYSIDGKFKISKRDAEGYNEYWDYGNPALSWGNVIKATNIQGLETIYIYDGVNRMTQKYDNNHWVATNYSYTLASATPYASTLPNARFAMTTTNSADGSYMCTITDNYGREIRNVKSDFNGNALYGDISYNSRGLIETETKPYKASSPLSKVTTTYTYNDYNMPIFASTDQGGADIQTDYNIVSGLMNTTVTNASTGKARTTESCGNVVRRITGNNETIEYEYFGNGVEKSIKVNNTVVPSNGNTITKTVDAYGRIKSVIEPNTGIKRFNYDALNRLVSEDLPSPDPSTNSNYAYTYDKIGRIIEKRQTTAPYTTYTYNYHAQNALFPILRGLLFEESVSTGYTYRYEYNSKGELQAKKELLNGTLYNQTLYDYYSNGKLKYYTFYNDVRIYYEYNGAGGLNKASVISAPDANMIHPLWFIWGKDPYGQLENAYIYSRNGAPLVGGGASNVIYDLGIGHNVHGYVTERSVNRLGGGMIPNIIYDTYDFNTQTGNLNSRTNVAAGNFKETFSYDTEYDRLTEVKTTTIPTSTFPDLVMNYANNGNITHKSDVSNTTLYPWKYDMYALQVVPQPSTPWPSVTRTSEIPFNTLQTDYYPFHKIKMVNEENENEVLFTYGATDERVMAEYYKLLPTKTLIQTKYYGENYEKIIDKLGNKTELFYVWGGKDLIAVLKTYTAAGSSTTTGNVYYPIRDYLGSITHFLDDLGTGGVAANGIVEERSYDAWGRMRDPLTYIPYENGAFPTGLITDRGYTGHEHIGLGSWQNNIINMNGRLYDPLIGRMFSPDNIIADGTNSQDYNKYTYARNNPLKFVDPDGNNPMMIAVGAVMGGLINTAVNARNINSFGDGAMYFAIGAASGAIGGTVASAFPGSYVVAGVLGGFSSGFISSAANTWTRGGSFEDGLAAGVTAGAVAGTIGGLMGAFNETFYDPLDPANTYGIEAGGPEDGDDAFEASYEKSYAEGDGEGDKVYGGSGKGNPKGRVWKPGSQKQRDGDWWNRYPDGKKFGKWWHKEKNGWAKDGGKDMLSKEEQDDIYQQWKELEPDGDGDGMVDYNFSNRVMKMHNWLNKNVYRPLWDGITHPNWGALKVMLGPTIYGTPVFIP